MAALSCSSGGELADRAVQSGAACYLGFQNKLYWVESSADWFGRAVTAGAIRLIHGGSPEEALADMKNGFEEIVQFFSEGDGAAPPDSVLAWSLAFWNESKVVLKMGVQTLRAPFSDVGES